MYSLVVTLGGVAEDSCGCGVESRGGCDLVESMEEVALITFARASVELELEGDCEASLFLS